MKKSRIFSALLVLALLSTCVIGGTFAKYTSTATGSDTATVAKWSFKLNDAEIAGTTPKTITIDLFSTIKDSDGSTDETDVASGKKIAPGTSGKFEIKVENTSEVTAKYDMTFTTNNDNAIPVEFSIDGGSTWKTSISDLNLTNQTIAIGAAAETKTVQWRWVYYVSDAKDATDTALGVLAQTAAPTLKVNVTVVATQVD